MKADLLLVATVQPRAGAVWQRDSLKTTRMRADLLLVATLQQRMRLSGRNHALAKIMKTDLLLVAALQQRVRAVGQEGSAHEEDKGRHKGEAQGEAPAGR